MNHLLQKIYSKQHLSFDESNQIFDQVIKGQLTDIDIASLLISLKMKGEQPEEIAGAAQALRANAISFPEANYITADSCGTGGSGMNTVNISTMVAFVLAELKLPMVKHGNRSISSKCGSADVLEHLGVKIDMSPSEAKQCLDKTRFCFLFAPKFHPGVGNVMPVRNALKTRTMFNLLGPLINPAKPRFQLMGVYSPELCMPAAQTLQLAGCQSAMVVHSNGYDEITLHSPTSVVELIDGKLKAYTISHLDFELPQCNKEYIGGNDPQSNAEIFIDLLQGKLKTPKMIAIANTVAANAGALLKMTDKANSLKQGAEDALKIIRSGKAFVRLQSVIDFSRKLEGKSNED